MLRARCCGDSELWTFDPYGAQEQLGLKLESTKGPVDTMVVDHIEMH